MESVGRNDVFQINLFRLQKSLSAWRAWVEIYAIIQKFVAESSLSAWRAWVEMLGIWCQGRHLNVALRMESVGRNQVVGQTHTHQKVALRMESVGRNIPYSTDP